MDSSVWRDVTSRDGGQSGSGDVIVGFRSGNRIRRVSPDRVFEGRNMSGVRVGGQKVGVGGWKGCPLQRRLNTIRNRIRSMRFQHGNMENGMDGMHRVR